MHPNRNLFVAVAGLALGAIAPAFAASGGSSPHPVLATSVASTGVSPSSVATAPDGSGGWFTAWYEDRSSGAQGSFVHPIFVQRSSANGAVSPGWPAYGIPAAGVAQDAVGFPALVGDGAGGVVVAWSDDVGGRPVLRVQRIAGDATRPWGASGATLASAATALTLVEVLADGAGGAFVAWIDQSDGHTRPFVQHVTGAGAIAPGWPAAGIALDPVTGVTGTITLLAHTSGVLVLWDRDGSYHFQHLDAAGTPLLGASGVLLAGNLVGAMAVSDGANGMLLTWTDNLLVWKVLAQRYDDTGAARWTAGGVRASVANSTQMSPLVAADGAGGAWVLWKDDRTGDDYLQRIQSDGSLAPGWSTGGLAMQIGYANPALLPDDTGLFLAWTVNGSPASVKARRIAADGTSSFPAGGLTLTDASADVWGGTSAARTASGSLLVAWSDRRFGRFSRDRYAQTVDASAHLAWTPPVFLGGDVDRQRNPALAKDAGGGAFLAWQDSHAGSWDVRSRRFSPLGIASTPVVLAAAGGDQFAPLATTALDGSHFVAWNDWATLPAGLRAQRLDPSDVATWIPDAVPNPDVSENPPATCPDGSNGAYLLIESGLGVMLQRWTAAGKWGAGDVVLQTPQRELDLDVHPDGSGGAIATWTEVIMDAFDENPFQYKLRAQRVNAAGVIQWTSGGVVVRTLGAALVPTLRTVGDESGGVFLVASEKHAANDTTRFQAWHVTTAGVLDPAWPAGGFQFRLPSSRNVLTGVTRDASGGIVFGWEDVRNGAYEVRVQRLNALGAPQWTDGGLPLVAGPGPLQLAGLVSDGGGGAIAAFLDGRGSSWDAYAQHLDASGAAQWGANGVAVCAAEGTQEVLRVESDGAGGALLAWQDERDPAHDEVRAARVDASGIVLWSGSEVTAVPPGQPGTVPHLALSRVWPNPTARALSMSLEVPAAGPARTEVLDVAGRVVWSRSSSFAAGRNEVRLEGTESLAPALYFVRVTRGAASAATRFVKIE